MNRKYKSLTICCITIFFLINFLINSNILMQVFFDTTKLWFNNLFPTIFVFFILTDILNNYHFPYYISLMFGKIISKIFKVPKEASYILLMSTTSGFPGNSKLIKEQLDSGIITSLDADKLLTMTHFSNPLFILYTIGHNFLQNEKIGLMILIVHFLTNFLIGFLFRNIYPLQEKTITKQLSKPLPFMSLLKTSITNTFKTLINVFGIVIFFALFTQTINLYLNLNPFSNILLNGLLEITNGLKLLSFSSSSLIKKAVLATFFISFGGFSIHMQIMSILSKYHLNYFLYLIARILHAIISSLIIFLLLI